MTATEFLDHYGVSLTSTAMTGPIHERPSLRARSKAFREVRAALHDKGVSDGDILSKIGEIMGYILAHLGDIAAILALVLPLFLTPAPTTTAVESDE